MGRRHVPVPVAYGSVGFASDIPDELTSAVFYDNGVWLRGYVDAYAVSPGARAPGGVVFLPSHVGDDSTLERRRVLVPSGTPIFDSEASTEAWATTSQNLEVWAYGPADASRFGLRWIGLPAVDVPELRDDGEGDVRGIATTVQDRSVGGRFPPLRVVAWIDADRVREIAPESE